MEKLDAKPFAVIRIVFGFVWLVDACFKWSPAFLNNFSGYLASAGQGQPEIISAWVNFWIKIKWPWSMVYRLWTKKAVSPSAAGNSLSPLHPKKP